VRTRISPRAISTNLFPSFLSRNSGRVDAIASPHTVSSIRYDADNGAATIYRSIAPLRSERDGQIGTSRAYLGRERGGGEVWGRGGSRDAIALIFDGTTNEMRVAIGSLA